MKPYYQDDWVRHYCSDALTVLRGLEGNSIDLLCTDPPYGISFMGKSWDKALPDINIWKECLRVLKPGAFAFVMSIPRSDCLSRMIISLEDAGFRVDFTPIYWTYASGFPKAQNIGKAVDKRLGVEREVVGEYQIPSDSSSGRAGKSFTSRGSIGLPGVGGIYEGNPITASTSPQAKALDGSYGGFQPKPAVEVIIVAMKPLSEKTFVDQALKNGKGITWLDDCRVPLEKEKERRYDFERRAGNPEYTIKPVSQPTQVHPGLPSPYGKSTLRRFAQGRFPANLLVSDDVLNDGKKRHRPGNIQAGAIKGSFIWTEENKHNNYPDSGSFSRYFDLDKWAVTFPFLIVPKASKSEKNKGLDLPKEEAKARTTMTGLPDLRMDYEQRRLPSRNNHPTVKPLKLMSYLITLGSRSGDTILDPFMGSGTTPLAAKELNRKCIGVEIEERYCEIAAKRCSQSVMRLDL